jgi:hypothetical protein
LAESRQARRLGNPRTPADDRLTFIETSLAHTGERAGSLRRRPRRLWQRGRARAPQRSHACRTRAAPPRASVDTSRREHAEGRSASHSGVQSPSARPSPSGSTEATGATQQRFAPPGWSIYGAKRAATGGNQPQMAEPRKRLK